jgi:hypothetical protein
MPDMIMSFVPIRMFERRIIVVIPDFKAFQGGGARLLPGWADRTKDAKRHVEKSKGRARGFGRHRGNCALLASDLRSGEPTFDFQKLKAAAVNGSLRGATRRHGTGDNDAVAA